MKRILISLILLVSVNVFGQSGNTEIPDSAKSDRPDVIALDPQLNVQTLEAGGYVVIVRHASREALEGPVLWAADRESKCIPGSELNQKGKDEAAALKAILEKYPIKAAEVLTTPTCRNIQMAQIIFGKYDKTVTGALYWPMVYPWDWQKYQTDLKELVSKPVKGVGNRFIFAHNNTLESLRIRGLPKELLQMGDFAVIKPMGNGNFKYLGNIKKVDMVGP